MVVGHSLPAAISSSDALIKNAENLSLGLWLPLHWLPRPYSLL
jgi:hypothetical protein